MKLLIDDQRDLPFVDKIARTYEKGIELLWDEEGTVWDILYLDHDLGSFQFSGYDIAKQIASNAILGFSVPIREVCVISANPVGADNIISILRSAGVNAYKKGYLELLRENS